MDDQILHDELGSGRGRTGLGVAAGSLLFAAVEAVLGFPNNALGLLIGVVGSIVGLTVWGVSRYSRVRLTQDHLQVGRERLRRSNLDTSFGVQDRGALTEDERGLIESPFPLSKSASVRMLGGAFGRIEGTDVVVLRAADGTKKLAIATRRPDELTDALRRWLVDQA